MYLHSHLYGKNGIQYYHSNFFNFFGMTSTTYLSTWEGKMSIGMFINNVCLATD